MKLINCLTLTRLLVVIALFSYSLHMNAQQSGHDARVLTQQPEGWRFELIPFPLEFAPTISLAGFEELLFAPGMYDPETEDFFSYVFIWQVELSDIIDNETLKQYFVDYYAGLYKVVSGDKKGKSIDVTLDQENNKFNGIIDWVEPFKTRQPQRLRFSGFQQICKDNTLRITVHVSPQPQNHQIWQNMQAIKIAECE